MKRQLGFRYGRGEESPGRLLLQVGSAWQRGQREALADLDLGYAQFVLLQTTSALHAAGERVTQRRLAQSARVDEMSTSQAVRALEERALIVRTPDPDDSRALLLAPTRAGKRLLAQATRRVEAADAAFFAAVGDDAPRLAGLLRRLAPEP